MTEQRDWLCPLCGRPPRVMSRRFRDSGLPWSMAYCGTCWLPSRKTPGAQIVGNGDEPAEALADWGRQVSAHWGRLFGGPNRDAEHP